MFLISFSIFLGMVRGFLKTKTPDNPAGKALKYFFSMEYALRRSRLRSTAPFKTDLGIRKEIRGVVGVLFDMNLNVKLGELRNFPVLKIFSTVLLSALFFLGIMLDSEFGSAFPSSP